MMTQKILGLTLMLPAMMACLGAHANASAAEKIFNEVDGTVIMEMENTASPLGEWKKRDSLKPFTGDCYLEFMGNDEGFGPPNSPLEYTFRINSDGNYWVSIRSHKRLTDETGHTARHDMCNDCYFRIEGDYESGNSGVPLEQMKKDTKFWGGSEDLNWSKWANKLVLPGDNIQDARFQFKAGETYTIVISGRAARFSLDRIVVTRKEDQRFNMDGKESPLLQTAEATQ